MSRPKEEPEAPPAPENQILRFGSFGVGVTFGRPSLFRWSKSNTHEIVLTDRRILLVRKPSVARTLFARKRGRVDLDVPLADILETKRLTFFGRPVVWLKWREGEKTREVSIDGTLGLGAEVVRLHERLEALIAARPPGP